MIYSTESTASIESDILPLLVAHYDEVRPTGSKIPFEPDVSAYHALDSAGLLRVYSARSEGMLAGYVMFVVSPSNLHHKGLRHAMQDNIYVLPKWRGLTGSRLMAYAEQQLKSEGVMLMTINVPKKNDWRRLAERWGFAEVETFMQKWIGG